MTWKEVKVGSSLSNTWAFFLFLFILFYLFLLGRRNIQISKETLNSHDISHGDLAGCSFWVSVPDAWMFSKWEVWSLILFMLEPYCSTNNSRLGIWITSAISSSLNRLNPSWSFLETSKETVHMWGHYESMDKQVNSCKKNPNHLF